MAHLLELNEAVVKRCQVGFEVSKSGTNHLQFFIHFQNAKTMSAVKKFMFASKRAHLKACKGTDFENWNYTKKDTNVLFSCGDEPREEGELSDWEKIVVMINEGYSNLEIIERFPSQGMRCQTALDKYRLEYDRKHMGWRDVEVTYLTGETGVGKTRHVMEKYGYSNVYRVTNHKNPFDTYVGQEVVVFEEFRSQQKVENMLNWLDGYPVELPARYADKLAKFTKVYIISNWEWEMQYSNLREEYPSTYAAWARRVPTRLEMKLQDQAE